ncbi:fibronectin type III domain-containing protein [Rhodococcus sp. Chr-9]|uniref:fibronectin type III domain-containing protein n=1 Tax=Rhodococcus sp. Chr-9 TaxID=713612 RepID=UPI0005753546|nr:fibronectin type III domain-containing protein [Rhodococcus sp. Chr-9]KHJ74650.1 hypothetical protein QR64_00205 [Rhodococcus sp. Chr-9]
MTVPGGGYPDGTFDDDLTGLNGLDEATWKQSKFDSAVGPYNTAQGNFKGEFISAPLFGGEVARLDNRIDELLIGTERAIRYTYSTSDVWTKHPAAYKVVADLFGGSTSGRRGTRSDGGQGGFSGGWERVEFAGADLENLPTNVAVTIGAGTEGDDDSDAGDTTFGSFAAAGGATASTYGLGNRSFKMRGGKGGFNGSRGMAGSDGPFHPGGSGGATSGGAAAIGGNGFSIDVGQVGTGSAGGGGGTYADGLAWFGARGGYGGWPSAPGGGGGGSSWGLVDATARGGNGVAGAAIVTVYVEDALGSPPSTPTNLAASTITSSSAHVTWDASTDDVMVRNYVLFLNGTRYAVVDVLYHDFVGLTASTAYEVQVQAVDIGDNFSELSAPMQFTTTA